MKNQKNYQTFNLNTKDFRVLGDYAEAGLEATYLALKQGWRSYRQHRIPIAGAAVELLSNGQFRTVIVGNNGRIPAPKTKDPGYPTDHGETAAIRQIKGVAKVHWDRVVFATTLSPCIMCGRTLQYLHSLGLKRIVVAEAKSFPGTIGMLKKLKGMKVVELTNAKGIEMMEGFARTYPWDWAADIGEVPPDSDKLAALHTWLDKKSLVRGLLKKISQLSVGTAAIVNHTGKVLVVAADERGLYGHNPCHSAVMIAMGQAGSAINLRECAVLFSPGFESAINLDRFGYSSLGACELFRPAVLVTAISFESSLSSQLLAAGIILQEVL